MIDGSVRESPPGVADIGASVDVACVDAAPAGPTPGGRLKVALKALDVSGLTAGWALAAVVTTGRSAAGPLDPLQLGLLAFVGVAVSLMAMASKRLWLSRVCAVRSAELEALGETAVISALAVLVVGDFMSYTGPARFGVTGAVASFVLVMAGRTAYSSWLRRARRSGRYVRRLVLVGTGARAAELAELIGAHPEAGYSIVGRCGPPGEPVGDVSTTDGQLRWLGGYADASRIVADVGADGALVVAGTMPVGHLNRTVRTLMRSGTHVHLSSGMRGISHHRLIPLPVAREPLFYVERTSLTRSQLTLKRTLDLVLGSLLLVVLAPVTLLAALAVKLGDGGPVLFRQERVGRDGRHFTLLKLRTMVPDAERRIIDLTARNDRSGGPLFKLHHDPRVTRVGRFLRATSIDELPQLLNVVGGDMSLVGPRPALPTEVAHFDDELRQRGRVLPGITGLWQVEARDDPSFSSYRRLDLYYVENWSISLDLAILARTVGAVLIRGGRMFLAASRDR